MTAVDDICDTGSSGDFYDTEPPEAAETRRRIARVRAMLEAPTATGADAVEAAADPNPAVRRAALLHRLCPDVVRRSAMTADPDPDVRAALVREAPVGQIPHTELCDDVWQVRLVLAERGDTPHDWRRRTAVHDIDGMVRRAALGRLDPLDDATLWDVLYRGHLGDCTHLLGRPSLFGRATVEQVLAIPHATLRAQVACRQDLTGEVITALGLGDPAAEVRRHAISNPLFPTRYLHDAFRDEEPGPRAAAVLRAPSKDPMLWDSRFDPATEVRLAALTHADLPLEVLEYLADDEDSTVQLEVAGHANCPGSALHRLARHRSASVREAAVTHANCPRAALDRACSDAEDRVVLAALRNPGRPSPSAILASLGGRPPSTVDTRDDSHIRAIRKEALQALAACDWCDLVPLPLTELSERDLRLVLTRHLAEAARDSVAAVRMAVATHPDLAAAEMTLLSADPDPTIREAVSRRLLESL